MRGRDSWGVWDGHVHTAIFTMDYQQDLRYSTWNSAQCHMAAWMEGESGGEWIPVYIYMAESLHCSPQLSQHCLSAIFQYKIKSLKYIYILTY